MTMLGSVFIRAGHQDDHGKIVKFTLPRNHGVVQSWDRGVFDMKGMGVMCRYLGLPKPSPNPPQAPLRQARPPPLVAGA